MTSALPRSVATAIIAAFLGCAAAAWLSQRTDRSQPRPRCKVVSVDPG